MSSPAFLTPLLTLEESDGKSKVEYVVGGEQLVDDARDLAAAIIADDAMVVACGKSPVLDRWRTRRDGGAPSTGAQLDVLTRIVVDVGEASGVELELSSSSARTHGGLSCPTLMPG